MCELVILATPFLLEKEDVFYGKEVPTWFAVRNVFVTPAVGVRECGYATSERLSH